MADLNVGGLGAGNSPTGFATDLDDGMASAWEQAARDAQPADDADTTTNAGGTGNVQVPGPGASWFGFGSPPDHAAGTLPGLSGLGYQLDRSSGTLNFTGPDGQTVANLSLRGNTIVTPDGHQVGTLRSDGGFDLSAEYTTDLARCHGAAPGPQMSPAPWASPMAQSGQPSVDSRGRAISSRAYTLTPPGDCHPDEQQRLQQDVKKACNTPFSCSPRMSQAELAARFAQSMACGTARDRINSKCFAGGDYVHREQAYNAWESAARCRDYMKP